VPSALIFIPGSIIVTMLLTTAGAWVGKMLRSAPPKPVNGISAFAAVGVLTTFLLLLAGGLVTSWDAGLAVVDWPNSFGYNMFLYPLSRMTGGIYYEHTHRLIGSLVGLTTLMLAILIQVRDKRGWVKGLAWSAFVLVVFQGILGGLRVTGNFTLSTSPEAMQPSLTLALIHGVTGQIFFALLTGLAVITSGSWQRESSIEKPSCATDRILFPLAFAALIIQLVLGATVRHYAEGLMLHIGFAVVVFTVVMTSAVRAWGIYPEKQTLSNLGLWVLSVLCIQFILGFTALWGITADPDPQVYRWFEVLFPTLHQAFGALLLALVVTKTIWFYRAIQPLSIAVAADPAPDTPARPQSA
jgi:cytochrome c oxidase assembly protein subunit 15